MFVFSFFISCHCFHVFQCRGRSSNMIFHIHVNRRPPICRFLLCYFCLSMCRASNETIVFICERKRKKTFCIWQLIKSFLNKLSAFSTSYEILCLRFKYSWPFQALRCNFFLKLITSRLFFFFVCYCKKYMELMCWSDFLFSAEMCKMLLGGKAAVGRWPHVFYQTFV